MVLWQGEVLVKDDEENSSIQVDLAFTADPSSSKTLEAYQALAQILGDHQSLTFVEQEQEFDADRIEFKIEPPKNKDQTVYNAFCRFQRDRLLTARVFDPFVYDPLVCKLNKWLTLVVFFKDGILVGNTVDTRPKRKRKRQAETSVATKRQKPLSRQILPPLTLLLARIFQKIVGTLTDLEEPFKALFPSLSQKTFAFTPASEALKAAAKKCFFGRQDPLQSAFLLAMSLIVYSADKQKPVDFADETKHRIIQLGTGLTDILPESQQAFYQFINSHIDDLYELLTEEYAWCDWKELYREYTRRAQRMTQPCLEGWNTSSGASTL